MLGLVAELVRPPWLSDARAPKGARARGAGRHLVQMKRPSRVLGLVLYGGVPKSRPKSAMAASGQVDRSLSPPPAPPPFRWACRCMPSSFNYTCGDQHFHRAALTCNDREVFSWNHLGDCLHTTGCTSTGCTRPDWESSDPRRRIFAEMTSNYRYDYCEDAPPMPPSPPPPSPRPPSGWCEQLQTSHSWSPEQQHQPANSLTSLAGVFFGLRGLVSRAAVDDAGLYRASCCLQILTGLGSAAHHWLPTTSWAHAADILPMLLLACVGLAHAATVLVTWPITRAPQRAAPRHTPRRSHRLRDLLLLLFWGASVLAMLSYGRELTDEFTLYMAIFSAALVGQIVCHVCILYLVARRACGPRAITRDPQPVAARAMPAAGTHAEAVHPMDTVDVKVDPWVDLGVRGMAKTADVESEDMAEGEAPMAAMTDEAAYYMHMHTAARDDATDACRIMQVYMALVVSIALAAPAQLLEFGGCPTWLFESDVSLHGIWHICSFFCAHHAAQLLHFFDTPHAVWHSPIRRLPWLLFRCESAAGCDGEGHGGCAPFASRAIRMEERADHQNVRTMDGADRESVSGAGE